MTAVPASDPYTNPQAQPADILAGHPPTRKQVEAESAVTLLIRHLPEAIPQDTLRRLLSHYGASAVRPCTGGRLRNCAFVDFNDETSASQAQRQLNGLRFLGKVLFVQRATKPTESKSHQGEVRSGKDIQGNLHDNAFTKEVDDGTKPGAIPSSEPIAPKLGVDYPFPPDLEYAYPPPDGNILTNIVNALIAVPRFYTQVLHLMNKMNIPPPFRMALPTPPLPSAAPVTPSQQSSLQFPAAARPALADPSSSESEMESDEEVDGKGQPLGVTKQGRKRPRHEAIVGPAVDKDVAHEAVGLKPATLTPKEIPVIKKNNPVLQIKIAPKTIQKEDRDVKEDIENMEQPVPVDTESKAFATPEELESGKLPPEEILSLPMFKNYTAGNPAPVLYIKNLAKDVVSDDFYYVFGSLFGSIDAAKSCLTVKLMQEGRMRGQAFLTFPSVELAHRALNVVNGYVFKGKPMIIQFGRNFGAAKKT